MIEPDDVEVDPIPDGLSGDSTVLVATARDPTRDAVCLRLLSKHGTDADTAFVVTTTESVERMLTIYEHLDEQSDRPSLAVVDTASARQSISALYGETPVVFTPSSGDLERLVLALEELSGNAPPSSGARHLVVRSLTPILESATAASVGFVLSRIIGLRSETGLCLLGIDYTAHDEETMTAIANEVDGVLWVIRSDDRLGLDYQPTKGRFERAAFGGDIDS